MLIKDVFTGEGHELLVEAAVLYEQKDLVGLRELPGMYVQEVVVARAAAVDEVLGATEFEPRAFVSVLERAQAVAPVPEDEAQEIARGFVTELVRAVMAHRRFVVVQNHALIKEPGAQEDLALEYALETRGKEPHEVAMEHSIQHASELREVLAIFGMSPEEYSIRSINPAVR